MKSEPATPTPVRNLFEPERIDQVAEVINLIMGESENHIYPCFLERNGPFLPFFH